MLHRNIEVNGATFKLAVSQHGSGAPTTATEGQPGVLYLDDNTGELYKCTAVSGGSYTWEIMPNAERTEADVPMSIADSYINYDTGDTTYFETCHRTGLVDVSGFDKVEFRAFLVTVGAALACYDKDKNYKKELSVQGAVPNWKSMVFDIPDGVRYIQYSTYWGSDGGIGHYCKLRNTKAVAARLDIIETELHGKETDFPSTGHIAYANGSLIEYADTQNTGYVLVENYKYIRYVGTAYPGTAALAFYNSDMDYMQTASVNGTNDNNHKINVLVPVPTGAAYVIASNYGYEKKEFLLYGDEIPVFPRLEALERGGLRGKDVLIFGDSIADCCALTINEANQTTAYNFRSPSNHFTDPDGQNIDFDMWPKILRDVCRPRSVRNYALSGATYCTHDRGPDAKRGNLQYQIDVAINDLDNPNSAFPESDFDPDVIIFALGTNDLHWSAGQDTFASAMAKTVLGADGESIDLPATIANLDPANFNESARLAYLRIKQRWPNALTFVVLPIQRASMDIEDTTIYKDLTKMGKRCGCDIIYGAEECGIIRDNNATSSNGATLSDGIHPNDIGQKMMARMIIKRIESAYADLNLL